MKKSRSSNPVLTGLIKELNRRANEEDIPLWRIIAKELSRSAAARPVLNVGNLARHTAEKDIVAVPGKVLASGSLAHPLTVAAFEFSAQARKKIISAGGKCLSLNELMDLKSKGAGVKLME